MCNNDFFHVQLSTCVAKSAESWTSDLNGVGSRPPAATKYRRYVLLVNWANKLNILSWILMFFCVINKVYSTKH